MPEQSKRLIQLLENEGPMSIKRASAKLQVSERSIRNYMRQANAKSTQILTDHSKIWVQERKPASLDFSRALPQNYRERSSYIIKKKIIEKEEVDLFDLSETLYVSYSTLKNDIAKMNQEFHAFQVHFRLKKDKLVLFGEERQIRKLISHVLAQETATHIIDMETLLNNYDKNLVHIIQQEIEQIVVHPALSKNDLAKMNLILHLVIISTRCQENGGCANDALALVFRTEKEKQWFGQLIDHLQTRLAITYAKEDLEQIQVLLAGNLNFRASEPSFEMDQKNIRFTSQILDLLEKRFHVDLNREEVKELFLRHLHNLNIRAQTGGFIKNPMKESIRQISPTIYEMAIVMAVEYKKYFQVLLPEDEIAFFAIHISSWIDQSNALNQKLKTLLVCPAYLNFQSDLLQTLSTRFADELYIPHVASSEQSGMDDGYDLVVSTIPLSTVSSQKVISLSPIWTPYTQQALSEKILKIKERKKGEMIRNHFFEYFQEPFFSVVRKTSKEALLHQMCARFNEKEIVASDFEKSVLEREKACSTAFGGFAIPHPLVSSARETKVSVALCPEGVLWNNDQKVYAVFLLAINEVDKRVFLNVYEPLVSLLSDEEFMTRLSAQTDFHAFSSLLIHKIK